MLLIVLGSDDTPEGWLHLADQGVAARGTGTAGLPPLVTESGDPLRIGAVVPGEEIALHWVELPAGLAPLQAAAAARLLAAELTVEPIEAMHVAVGPEIEGSMLRCVALAPIGRMTAWVARLQADGLDPDLILPEPLLLAPPETGFLRFDRDALALYRGPADAFTLEPELAAVVLGEAAVETLDGGAFEAQLPVAIADPAVNLRQGTFAKRRRWAIDWPGLRRIAALGLALLVVTLAIQIATKLRYTYETDALEAEAQRIASAALPSDQRGNNAAARLEARLSALGGSGPGFAALAPVLFGAVRDTANVEMTGLSYGADGSLRAALLADAPAMLADLVGRLEASGLQADLGPITTVNGRQAAEITLRRG